MDVEDRVLLAVEYTRVAHENWHAETGAPAQMCGSMWSWFIAAGCEAFMDPGWTAGDYETFIELVMRGLIARAQEREGSE